MSILSKWGGVLYNEDEHIYQIHKESNVKQNQNEVVEVQLRKHKKIEIQDKKHPEDHKRKFDDKGFCESYHMYLRGRIMAFIFIAVILSFFAVYLIIDMIYFFNTGL